MSRSAFDRLKGWCSRHLSGSGLAASDWQSAESYTSAASSDTSRQEPLPAPPAEQEQGQREQPAKVTASGQNGGWLWCAPAVLTAAGITNGNRQQKYRSIQPSRLGSGRTYCTVRSSMEGRPPHPAAAVWKATPCCIHGQIRCRPHTLPYTAYYSGCLQRLSSACSVECLSCTAE